MTKQTYASITEIPCSCGTLERTAQDPNSPIKFNSEFNEYQIDYKTPAGNDVSVVIYHCIFCGGSMPESRRKSFFMTISVPESERLSNLLKGIFTLKDALRVLGDPDFDDLIPAEEDAKTTDSVRSLTFTRLSDVADVHITAQPNGRAHVMIAPKAKDKGASTRLS